MNAQEGANERKRYEYGHPDKGDQAERTRKRSAGDARMDQPVVFRGRIQGIAAALYTGRQGQVGTNKAWQALSGFLRGFPRLPEISRGACVCQTVSARP